MIAPIAYERRAGVCYLPERSIVMMMTNLAVEGLGDSLQAHLRNRLIVVKMRKATMDEWINDFALPNRLNGTLIACVSEHDFVFDSFLDYEKGGKYEGRELKKDNPAIYNPYEAQDAYASLRSLHAASDLIDAYEAGGMDDQTLEIALAGAVGESYAEVMMSFIKFGQQIPAISLVRDDPDNAPLPRNNVAQQVMVFKMIGATQDRDDAEAFTKYVQRLQPELQSLFLRRVSESSFIGHYVSVAAFGAMLRDNKIYYKV